MMKQTSTLILLAAAGLSHAHEGHGMPGISHWHAGDLLMLLAAGAVAALGLWLARRR